MSSPFDSPCKFILLKVKAMVEFQHGQTMLLLCENCDNIEKCKSWFFGPEHQLKRWDII